MASDTDIFITKIDDFYFRILNKNEKHSRLIVNIYSSKNEELIKLDSDHSDQVNKFSVYLSKSDLGCFRLCLLGLQGYIKGEYDYIQQTFIHIELQKFIYECLNNLKKSEDIEFCNINGDNYNKKIFDNINRKNRLLRIEPFFTYNENYKCGEDNKYDNTLIISELNSFSKSLEELYSCEYKDNQLLFSHTVNDETNNYILDFFKIKLKLKQKSEYKYIDNIILYYYNVKIKKFKSQELPNEMSIFLPLFLTLDDKITEFGTFNTYILAGNYICKLFDYTEQCSKDLSTYKCFGGYSLIGDRYSNIFPFNIIMSIAKQYAIAQLQKISEYYSTKLIKTNI
jgi:hypothetical protein